MEERNRSERMPQKNLKTTAVVSAKNEKHKVPREPIIKDLFTEVRESLSIKEVRTDPSKTRSWLGEEERKDREREGCPGEGSVQEE